MNQHLANDLIRYAELVEDEALISPEEMNCAAVMRLAAEALVKKEQSCCAECGQKDSDGFALYCVECMDKINSHSKQEQGEPVAYIHRNEYNEYRLEPHDNFDIKSIPFNVDVPLFK